MPEILVHVGAILLGFISYTIIMCYIFWNVGFNSGYSDGVKMTERKYRTKAFKDERVNQSTNTQKSVDLNSHPIYIKRN